MKFTLSILISLFVNLSTNAAIFCRYGGRNTWTSFDTLIASIGLGILLVFFMITFIKSLKYANFKKTLNIKTKLAEELIVESAKEDKVWDKDSLIELITNTFHTFQESFTKQNMNIVKHLVTDDFAFIYQRIHDTEIRRGYFYYINNVNIQSIEIVGINDSYYNEYDNFTARIKSSMTKNMQYMGDHFTLDNSIICCDELYYFVRYNDSWYLNGINSDINWGNVENLIVQKES